MIRKLLSLITGRPIVALQDFDGEVVWRLAFKTPWGWQAMRGLGSTPVSLNPDGTCRHNYTRRWWSAAPLPECKRAFHAERRD